MKEFVAGYDAGWKDRDKERDYDPMMAYIPEGVVQKAMEEAVGKRLPLMAALPGEERKQIGWVDVTDLKEGVGFEGKFLESNIFAKYISVGQLNAFSIEVRETPDGG